MKPRGTITLRTVIELGVETVIPPLDTIGGQFAAEIRAQAAGLAYTKTPDGWFVPIRDILNRVEQMAEYFKYEAIEYGEFEIGGGIEVLKDGKVFLSPPLGANLALAMKCIDIISDWSPEKQEQRIWISAQDFWVVSSAQESIKIQVGKMAKFNVQDFSLPFHDFKEQLLIARREIEELSAKLVPLIMRYQVTKMTLRRARALLGL